LAKSCSLSFSQAILISSGSTIALKTIFVLLIIFSIVEVSIEISTDSALTVSVKFYSLHIFCRVIIIALVNLKNESLLSMLFDRARNKIVEN
jgi:hypothetical protein